MISIPTSSSLSQSLADTAAWRHQTPLLARARETLTSAGRLTRHGPSRRQRTRSGAKMCLALWALALVSLFVPLVHFVLTPALLLAGPIAGWMRYRGIELSPLAELACPICHETIALQLVASVKLPHWADCTACGNPIQLRAAMPRETLPRALS